MTKTIYNLKSGDYEEQSYIISKFDHGLEMESSYRVTLSNCECPQGERGKTCRHQKMLPMFLALARQDTEYFLDFDTKTWHRPLATSYEVEYHDLLIKKKDWEYAKSVAKQPAPQGVQVIPIASAVSPPPDAPALAAASATSEVPCVVAEAAPIKRRRI